MNVENNLAPANLHACRYSDPHCQGATRSRLMNCYGLLQGYITWRSAASTLPRRASLATARCEALGTK